MRSVIRAVNWPYVMELFSKAVLFVGGAYLVAHVALWLIVD